MPIPNMAIDCAKCGLTSGVHTDHGLRCSECGRFASGTSDYCARHDVLIDKLPNRDFCPYCRQERQRDTELAERAARRSDPNMHNSIDAPANAIDHSAPMSDFI